MAWRAERIWQAIESGALKVQSIPGLRGRLLLITANSRIQQTLHREGKTIVKRRRFTMGRFLHSRWVPLEQVFDEVYDSQIDTLDQETLAKKGVYRIEDDQFYVLIYQYVQGLPEQIRQFMHIEQGYSVEIAKIQTDLDRIEDYIISLLEDSAELSTDLRETLLKRIGSIGTIQTILASRSTAVEILRQQLVGRLSRISQSLPRILGSSSFKLLCQGDNRDAEGLQRVIALKCDEIDSLPKIQPIAQSLERAQRYLEAAIGAVLRKKAERADYYLNQARKALDLAISLIPPQEELISTG